MTTTPSPPDVVRLGDRSAGPAVEERAPVPSDGPAPTGLTARERHEIDALARRLRERHPRHPLADLTALVAGTYAALTDARVQTYRLVLTERAVRRHLATRSTEATTEAPLLADAG